MHAIRSPGEVVPGSQDPGSGGLHRLPGGGLWIVTCARTKVFGGCSSSLSISCLSLGSALISVARALLWSSFRQWSESPLLTHSETMVSCLLSRSRLFPGLPPCSLWCICPLQAVFTQPTPVLSLGCDLQRGSLSSQVPPFMAGEQTSLSGW